MSSGPSRPLWKFPLPGHWSRWASLALGVVTIALGLWLILRPVKSLHVLVLTIAIGVMVIGISRLMADDEVGWTRALGLVWILVGVGVLFWPGLTLRLLSLVVGIHLIVDGLSDVVRAVKSQVDQPAAELLLGMATVVFGVLALRWPDVTVLVVAVMFAFRLIVFGVRQVARFFGDGTDPGEDEAPVGRVRRWSSALGAALVLLFAGSLALVSFQLNSGVPVVDEFYDAPASVPDEPGALLKVEPFHRGIPADARGWRILYTTTRDEGQPALASALVVAPETMSGPAPVIAWAHGTTGVDRTCAPSVLEGTFTTGALFSVDEIVDEGWVLVASDYVGLGTEGPHPYLTGYGEARSVLDAVRAAREMDDIRLGEPTVVWGHSQGGNTALWTGVLAPGYAPDVELAGIAALAPASDLVGLVDTLRSVTGGAIFASYVVSAYSAVYDDVRFEDYVLPGGAVAVREIAGRCLAEPSVLTSVLTAVSVNFSAFRPDLSSGALATRLVENTAPYRIEAPLLLAQGAADTLITPQVQDAYVEGMCAAGREVDYRTYPGLGHVPLVAADSALIPDLVAWTRARLAGEDPVSTC